MMDVELRKAQIEPEREIARMGNEKEFD